jgi:crotonobetainyl-CoA:carnitine CoA-transferase CaiB-like acyl-CoA transferase
LAPDIMISNIVGRPVRSMSIAAAFRNPLVGAYRTADDRLIKCNMITSDRYWPGLCNALDRPDLIEHPGYAGIEKRSENFEALEALLRAAFAARTLADWGERLEANGCVWDPVQSSWEVISDPQVVANGYLMANPKEPRSVLAAPPIQYNNQLPEVRAGAPEYGQHTEEVLLDLGYDWDELLALKEKGVIA